MKILLIEDDTNLVAALKMSLTKEGYVVDAITNGILAKQRIKLHRGAYDVIILDLTLPGMSGQEICTYTRAQKITTPILILTGRTEVEQKIAVLDCGADDYLTKPFSVGELIARVRALLRRPKEVMSKTVIVGDLMLDMTRRIVIRKGKEITLSHKEFGILEYLMYRPNQVVQRDEILDHVWDYNYTSLGNIVDVHINRIRSKLAVKRGQIVETVRGVGYRLKV